MARPRLAAAVFRAAIASLPASMIVHAAALADETAKPDPRRGEEVGQICFARSIDGFRTVKGVDDAVLLERSVNDWYYVELIGMCSERQLRFAQSVAIVSRPSGGCVTPGDRLVFSDSAFFSDRPIERNHCTIRRIYKWNEDAAAPDESKPGETKPAETPPKTE